MTIITRITEQFEAHTALTLKITKTFAPQIASATEWIVQTQLDEGKILVCGDKDSMALADYFTSRLINQHELERPGLAAVMLNSSTAMLDCFTHDGDIHQLFAKQIMALGREGDILVLLAKDSDAGYVLNAITIAHECGMRVIFLSGHSEELIQDRCIHIAVPNDSVSRINEIHLLNLHCLCDAIDYTLLGAN